MHCEPCRKIRRLAAFDDLVHKRGYLGCFLNRGTIAVGDAVAVTDERHDAIPYAVKDRMRWFLGRQTAGLAASDPAHALGFPGAIARMVERGSSRTDWRS